MPRRGRIGQCSGLLVLASGHVFKSAGQVDHTLNDLSSNKFSPGTDSGFLSFLTLLMSTTLFDRRRGFTHLLNTRRCHSCNKINCRAECELAPSLHLSLGCG